MVTASCKLLFRAWTRYLHKLHYPKEGNITVPEFITFILAWVQHFQGCQTPNPFRCYRVFSSAISDLLPLNNQSTTTTLNMVMWRHLSTYKSFLNTIHLLQIPLTKWGITFIPRVIHMEKGMKEYHLARINNFPSLYLSTPNPKILGEQPFEVEIIVETEEEESPTPSPPSTPTPSPSKNSHTSLVLKTKRS
jgi:hypothetical protein